MHFLRATLTLLAQDCGINKREEPSWRPNPEIRVKHHHTLLSYGPDSSELQREYDMAGGQPRADTPAFSRSVKIIEKPKAR